MTAAKRLICCMVGIWVALSCTQQRSQTNKPGTDTEAAPGVASTGGGSTSTSASTSNAIEADYLTLLRSALGTKGFTTSQIDTLASAVTSAIATSTTSTSAGLRLTELSGIDLYQALSNVMLNATFSSLAELSVSNSMALDAISSIASSVPQAFSAHVGDLTSAQKCQLQGAFISSAIQLINGGVLDVSLDEAVQRIVEATVSVLTDAGISPNALATALQDIVSNTISTIGSLGISQDQLPDLISHVMSAAINGVPEIRGLTQGDWAPLIQAIEDAAAAAIKDMPNITSDQLVAYAKVATEGVLTALNAIKNLDTTTKTTLLNTAQNAITGAYTDCGCLSTDAQTKLIQTKADLVSLVRYLLDLPTVTLDAPPNNNIVNRSNVANYALSGSCTNGGATVSIGGSVSLTLACSGNKWSGTVDLSSVNDGNVSITIDYADNTGQAAPQLTTNLTKDTVAPAASLIGVPTDPSGVVALNITVGGTDVTHYKYKVAAAVDVDCGSKTGYSDELPVTNNITQDISSLADGQIGLCVIGRDANGNYQDNATTLTWTKDTTAPTALLSGTPSGSNTDSNLSATVGGMGSTYYKYKIVVGSDCSSSSGYSSEVPISSTITDSIANLPAGTISLCVVARDQAGNYQAFDHATVASWLKTPIAQLTNAPSGVSSASALNVTVGGTGITNYRYKITTGSVNSCDQNAGYSTDQLASVAISDSLASTPAGIVNLCVIARDSEGNYQPLTQASVATWYRGVSVSPLFDGTASTTGAAYNGTFTSMAYMTSTTFYAYASFTTDLQDAYRGIMEFTLPAGCTPGAVLKAQLEFKMATASYNSVTSYYVYGFAGSGSANVSDSNQTGNLIKNVTGSYATIAARQFIDVTSFINSLTPASSVYAGFLIEAHAGQLTFYSKEATTQQPVLNLSCP